MRHDEQNIEPESPKITWVLATHVVNDYVKKAIESCLRQKFTNFECLIIANGEFAEDVATKIKEWFDCDTRIRIVKTDVRELSFSLSLGIHLAKGELIARMDADDISFDDRLQKQMDFMASNPRVVVLGTQYEIIDQNGLVINRVKLPLSNNEIKRKMYFTNPICHPSVVFRRKDILKVGAYLGGLHAEDYDLWVRLSNFPDIEFANLPTTHLQYRSLGIGNARSNRNAYATMAGTQIRNFLAGHGLYWGVASVLSIFKLIIKSKKN